MFYVYILYMRPTVWIRSIIIIFNSIYHYQSGMKTCYICSFFFKKEKRPSVKPFGLYSILLFRYSNVISLDCCQYPFIGLLESMWKNIFRRNPTLREFKIECNRILLFIVSTEGILYASYKFVSKCSCWFLEDIIL